MVHLLGSFFTHHLGRLLGAVSGTWVRTGVGGVGRAVGILPVAENDAADSHVGGAHLDLHRRQRVFFFPSSFFKSWN